ncbi:hypothetical protein RND64_08790 [Gordonia sp. w5E2]|uniref:hypothetical protein n=1 Tax=Gordonia TaxID=2053 RepID=UPI0022E73068|nr:MULTISPECIES: hypothetical protein [Gordonia]
MILTDLGNLSVVAEQRADGLHDVVARVVIDSGFDSQAVAEDEAAAWRMELDCSRITVEGLLVE